ncbi:hypothetical protein ABZ741_33940 [Streptomyces globisporus]|uniref:hypothetical protein n=1 Tax=Streptomyces globisporus TaxID=1908 RepID=UPI00345F3F20
MAPHLTPMSVRDVASQAGVQPGTIRQWRFRGYITPIGGTPRFPLFDTAAVLAVCGRHGCTRPLCTAAAAEGDARRNVITAMFNPSTVNAA